MTVIRVPTPLRPFTDDNKEVDVSADSVGSALEALAERYPQLKEHLFDENEELRPFVNVFLNDEDVRTLQGADTPLSADDRLMIVPSIAGGSDSQSALRAVDHNALRINQAAIITLLLLAFILNLPLLAGFVALMMLGGTLIGKPGFVWLYRLLRAGGLLQPDLIPDNPQPHRFSQGLGALFVSAGVVLYASIPAATWVLAWIVIALASLNLFAGFCVGCAMYYWFHRLGLPGFNQSPPPGVLPGKRPSTGG